MSIDDNGKSITNCIAKEASPIESEIHPSHKPYGSYSVYFASRGGALRHWRHKRKVVIAYKKSELYTTCKIE